MTPVLRLVLGFSVGLAAGLRFGDPGLAVTGAACGAIACVLGLRTGVTAWLTAAAAAAGMTHGAVAAVGVDRDCRAHLPDGAAIEARVRFQAPPAPGGTARAVLESVRVRGRFHACAGVVRVRMPADPGPTDGVHARVAGTWWTYPGRGAWPVPPERRGVLAAKSVSAAAVPHRHPLTRMRHGAIRAATSVFTRERALAESILLAHRDDLDPELRHRFAAAGIAHMLAISGAHVAVLAGVMLLLFRMAGAGARAAPAGTAVGAVAWVVVLGAPAAAARASLQILLLLGSRMVQRPADPLSLMAVAALVLLVARPLSLLEPGFQLSFAGVFGLLSFRAPLAALLPRRLHAALRDTLAASLAATLATAPIVAWRFGIVSLVGPLANLVAAPVMALALPAAALALTVGVWNAAAGAFLGEGAGLLLSGLRVVADAAARPDWGHAWVPGSAVTAALAGSAAAFRFGPAPRVRPGISSEAKRRAIRARHLARAGMAAATAALILALGSVGRGTLEIHAIDVGQGDAIAIRTPRSRWILIDTGPRFGDYDAGRQRVAPYLLNRGATRLEALILTHPDADHVGGARWLWQVFDVGTVLDPAVPTGKGVYLDVLHAARNGRTPWYAARAGRELRIDDVVIRVIAPPDTLLDPSGAANDFSVVVHLEYGSFGALFLGDAPRRIENGLVERLGSGIRSALIKVGHHGSRTSTGDSLLDAARPAVALLSVGRRNRYGHPAPEVMGRLVARGITVLRTDRGGSIEVRVRPDAGMEVRRR